MRMPLVIAAFSAAAKRTGAAPAAASPFEAGKFTPKTKDGKPTGAKRRSSMGFLPAIPIEVVQK